MSKEKPAGKPAQVQPKIVYKNQMEFDTHAFKLQVATGQRNRSWKPYNPELQGFEHCHFFHTKNSAGRAQTTSTSVGGHFHEVSIHVDQDGNLEAKVGPAKRRVKKKMRDGSVQTVVEDCKFLTKDPDAPPLMDNHTHEAIYVGTDKLSPDKIKKDLVTQGGHIAPRFAPIDGVRDLE